MKKNPPMLILGNPKGSVSDLICPCGECPADPDFWECAAEATPSEIQRAREAYRSRFPKKRKTPFHFPKGSPEAKAYMAKIRGMRGAKGNPLSLKERETLKSRSSSYYEKANRHSSPEMDYWMGRSDEDLAISDQFRGRGRNPLSPEEKRQAKASKHEIVSLPTGQHLVMWAGKTLAVKSTRWEAEDYLKDRLYQRRELWKGLPPEELEHGEPRWKNPNRPLSPFDQWMVKQNLQYVKAEGLMAVVNRLRAQGYNSVADAVERESSGDFYAHHSHTLHGREDNPLQMSAHGRQVTRRKGQLAMRQGNPTNEQLEQAASYERLAAIELKAGRAKRARSLMQTANNLRAGIDVLEYHAILSRKRKGNPQGDVDGRDIVGSEVFLTGRSGSEGLKIYLDGDRKSKFLRGRRILVKDDLGKPWGASMYKPLRNPPSGPVDEDAARELELFITNDADLYRQQYSPIIVNLMRKRKKGVFDPSKAVKLFMYLVDNGARKYMKEVGGTSDPIDRVFNRNTRLAVAKTLTDQFIVEADLGNYDRMVNSAPHYLRGRKAFPVEIDLPGGFGRTKWSVWRPDHIQHHIYGNYKTQQAAIESAQKINEMLERGGNPYVRGEWRPQRPAGMLDLAGESAKLQYGEKKLHRSMDYDKRLVERMTKGLRSAEDVARDEVKRYGTGGLRKTKWSDEFFARHPEAAKELHEGEGPNQRTAPCVVCGRMTFGGSDRPTCSYECMVKDSRIVRRGGNPVDPSWRGLKVYETLIGTPQGGSQEWIWTKASSVEDAMRKVKAGLPPSKGILKRSALAGSSTPCFICGEPGNWTVEWLLPHQRGDHRTVCSSQCAVKAAEGGNRDRMVERGGNPHFDGGSPALTVAEDRVRGLAIYNQRGQEFLVDMQTWTAIPVENYSSQSPWLSKSQMIDSALKKFGHPMQGRGFGHSRVGNPLNKKEVSEIAFRARAWRDHARIKRTSETGPIPSRDYSRGGSDAMMEILKVYRKKKYIPSYKRRMGNPMSRYSGSLPPHLARDPRFIAELAAYRRRHGNAPVEIRKIKVPKGYPKYLSAWGRIPEVKYDASPHSNKGKRIHKFGEGVRNGKHPFLVSSVEGGKKFLSIVGGTYRANGNWIYH